MEKIYQLLDVDFEPLGLLKVKSRFAETTEGEMELAVKKSAEDGYQDELGDWGDANELIDLIISNLSSKGYDAERVFVENINMI